MKKIFSFFIVFILFFTHYSFAAQTTSETTVKKARVQKYKSPTMTKRINDICDNLLEKNKISTKVRMKLRKTNKVNAYASMSREIVVFSGLVKICENDDELAGVIAHELGHIVNAHVYKLNAVNAVAQTSLHVAKEVPIVALPAALVYKVGFKKWMRMDEYESDVTAVDLLVGAGYNPLGMVSIIQKISGEKYADFLATHPSGEKRTLYIYDYIAKAYPQYIEKGFDTESFEEFLYYWEDVQQERAQNPEKMIKHEKKFNKLEEKRKKKYAKYQRRQLKQEQKQKELEKEKANSDDA